MAYNKKSKVKCLFVIPRMGNGGAERVLATLANELTKQDYEIKIITLTSDESFYKLEDGVEIIGAGYEISKNKLIRNLDMFNNGVRSLFYINRNIKEWQPQIVISFLTHTNILSLIIKFFHPKMKLIISERCEPWVRNFPTRIITKYFYPFSDVIVCQSKMVSEFFPRHAKGKIRVIQNPINMESISNEIIAVRRKTIIGVGRLFEQKNFSLLIDCFNDIKDDFPEHKLEIYGEGHLRDKLQQQINDLELADRAFLMGVKSNVMKYVSDAELYVMSSNFEGFPNALVEAMASGMPVISTDFSTGVARELIKEDNGIIIPVGDRNSMTQAMRKILSNTELRKTMSSENKKIKKDLSTEVIVKKWVETFREII